MFYNIVAAAEDIAEDQQKFNRRFFIYRHNFLVIGLMVEGLFVDWLLVENFGREIKQNQI